jgi:hypothetical protein
MTPFKGIASASATHALLLTQPTALHHEQQLTHPCTGDAAGTYSTAAHEGMELVDKSLKEGERRGPDVKKNKALKLALTRTNFKFGEEVCVCA